jgi:hypothetical protein
MRRTEDMRAVYLDHEHFSAKSIDHSSIRCLRPRRWRRLRKRSEDTPATISWR